jgi:Ni/Co efflux regulator RcnB
MKTGHKALLLSLLATSSLAISLPAAAERGKHDGHRSERHSNGHGNGHGNRDDRGNHDNRSGGHRRGHDRGHYSGHDNGRGESHYDGGHGRHDRHWSPPRHGHNRHHYYPRPVYGYAPPRFLYVSHGVYGYHDGCGHGYEETYAPGYGSGLSLWLDGIGFSYFERGW